MSPSFADLRTITHGIDCLLNGRDPYVVSLCDPWGRVYNYPSIWLHLGNFGISSAATDIIGTIFIVLTIISLLLLFHTETAASAIIVFLASCSPPILFGLERGNVDVFIFSILVIFYSFLSKMGGRSRSLGISCTIILLTVLKIYPIAAAAVFARGRRGYLYAFFTALVAIVALLLTAGGHELKAIAANTPQQTWLSYGELRIFLAARQVWWHQSELGDKVGSLPFDSAAGFASQRFRLMSGVFTLTVAMGSIYLLFRRSKLILNFVPELEPTSARGAIAISCLAIFCFTFMLGSNFDYRLIFLLGVLSGSLHAYDIKRQRSLLIVPGVILIFCWLSFLSIGTLPFLLDELLDWVLFLGGIAWLAVIVCPLNSLLKADREWDDVGNLSHN